MSEKETYEELVMKACKGPFEAVELSNKHNARLIAHTLNEFPVLMERNKKLVEALDIAIDVITDYVEYEHSGDPNEEDSRVMGEMDIDDLARNGGLNILKQVLKDAKEVGR